jgi:agmatine deiminase
MEEPFRYPAEWEPHDAVWLAWPAHQSPWESTPMAAVRSEFVALCRAIGEPLKILVPDQDQEREAAAAMGDLNLEFHHIPFGDIWLRDTAPIFTLAGKRRCARVFRFNGWGEKFVYPGDDTVATRIAEKSGEVVASSDWVLEGGSIDTDGEGTFLTTAQCLLNPNRNPRLDRAAVEARLGRDLGATRVLWLQNGLAGDHTDGHIDNIARFVGPGKVVCMTPSGADDPNAATLLSIQEQLEAMTDAAGRPLEVFKVSSPGRVLDRTGSIMAASHLNFYIANKAVVVPMYPESHDTGILEQIQALFASRQVKGLPAWNILHGGGSFHCITQQVPSL